MEQINKRFVIKPKPKFIEELKNKRESMFMLGLASVLGILASLVANIIENFFGGNKEYGLIYPSIVILCFIITLAFLIKFFWRWKLLLMISKSKRLIKKNKKYLDKKLFKKIKNK